MLELQHTRRWQIASAILLLLVLAAALMPAVWFWDDKRAGLSWFASNDKWLHGITFLVLSIWFAGLYPKSVYWKIGLGLLLFGLGIEVCQRMVGYRSAELMDVGADAAGIALGLLISAVGIGGWCMRVESYIAEH